MVDLGFESQLTAILERMPKDTDKPDEPDALLQAGKLYRQTFMFSVCSQLPLGERLSLIHI